MTSRAILLSVALLSLPAAGALGSPVEGTGAFLGYGTVELLYNGFVYGECELAVSVVSEADGGWSISAYRVGVPVVQYCTSSCCGSLAYYPGAADAQGSPETGFEGSAELLGVRNVVRLGALGPATPFELTGWDVGNDEDVSGLRGTLAFAPRL